MIQTAHHCKHLPLALNSLTPPAYAKSKFYASEENLFLQSQEPLNPEHQLGSILLDKYRLDSILGEGSFAVVFSATALSSNTIHSSCPTAPATTATGYVADRFYKVAVKCLYKTGLSQSQLALQREEIVLLNRVASHPNITTLLDICETEHHLYMVLEYCELDLFDGILKSPFSATKALELFEELVNAVAACHDIGVYHRDLKPENVLLTCKQNPHVRLTDFGLATTDAVSTEFGCGSVRYMSPECLSSSKTTGSSVDEKSKQKGTPYLSAANDVWSLAIILINMLTAKNPWVEPNSKDKHFRTHLINSQNRVDSFQSQFNFSDGLCQVLRLVFCSSPENRPSAREFLALVKRLPFLFVPSKPCPLSIIAANVKQSIIVPSKKPITTTQIATASKPAISLMGLVSPSSFVNSTNDSSVILPAPINLISQPNPVKLVLPPTPQSESMPTQTVNHLAKLTDIGNEMIDKIGRSSSPLISDANHSEDLLFVMDEYH